MFKYPSGRTVMNTVVWLIGIIELLFGVLIVVSSLLIDSSILFDNPLMDVMLSQFPMLEILLEGSIMSIGLVVIISSFPILIFSEIHMYSKQNNKMMKKMFDKIK